MSSPSDDEEMADVVSSYYDTAPLASSPIHSVYEDTWSPVETSSPITSSSRYTVVSSRLMGSRCKTDMQRQQKETEPGTLMLKEKLLPVDRLLMEMVEFGKTGGMAKHVLLERIEEFTDFRSFYVFPLESMVLLKKQLENTMQILLEHYRNEREEEMEDLLDTEDSSTYEWEETISPGYESKMHSYTLSLCIMSLHVFRSLVVSSESVNEEYLLGVISLVTTTLKRKKKISKVDMGKLEQIVEIIFLLLNDTTLNEMLVTKTIDLVYVAFANESIKVIERKILDLFSKILQQYPDIRTSIIEEYLVTLYNNHDNTQRDYVKIMFVIIEASFVFDNETETERILKSLRINRDRAESLCDYFVDKIIHRALLTLEKDGFEGYEIVERVVKSLEFCLSRLNEFPSTLLFVGRMCKYCIALINSVECTVQHKQLSIEIIGGVLSLLNRFSERLKVSGMSLCGDRLTDNFASLHSFLSNPYVSNSLKILVLEEFNLAYCTGDEFQMISLIKSLVENEHETITEGDGDILSESEIIMIILSESMTMSFNQLLLTLSDENISIRIKSVRSFSLVVQSKPACLTDEVVIKLLKMKITDESTQVRETILDCLMKSYVYNPDVLDVFKTLVMERLYDPSRSVRKKALKLTARMFYGEQDHKEQSIMLQNMVDKLFDPETIVKEQALGYVHEIFEHFTRSICENRDRLSDITSEELGLLERFIHILSSFFARIDENSSINVMSVVFKRTNKLDFGRFCKLCIEYSFDRFSNTGMVCDELNKNIFNLLFLFSHFDPHLFVGYFSIIVKIITDQTKEIGWDPIIFGSTISIVINIVSNIPSVSLDTILTLEKCLLLMLNKCSYKPIESILHLFSIFIKTGNTNVNVVSNLWYKLYILLRKGINPEEEISVQVLSRGFVILSLICKYVDLDHYAQHLKKQEPWLTMLRERSFLESAFDLFIVYMKNNSFSKHEVFVSSLCRLLCAKPSFLIEESLRRWYESVFKGSDTEMKTFATHAIFLTIDSIRKTVEDNVKDSLSEVAARGVDIDEEQVRCTDSWFVKVHDNGDGIMGIYSVISNHYFPMILEGVLSTDPHLQKKSIEFMTGVVLSGSVHPAKVIPYYIAVNSIPNHILKELVQPITAYLDRSHSSFFHSRMKETTLLIYKSGLVPSHYINEEGYSVGAFQVYYSKIRQRKNSCIDLFKAIFRHIEDNLDNLKFDSVFHVFLLESISYMYFKMEDELFTLFDITTRFLLAKIPDMVSELQNSEKIQTERVSGILMFSHVIDFLLSVYDVGAKSNIIHLKNSDKSLVRSKQLEFKAFQGSKDNLVVDELEQLLDSAIHIGCSEESFGTSRRKKGKRL